MHPGSLRGRHPLRPVGGLSTSERIAWLAVACSLDRARFRLSLRPTLSARILTPLVKEIVPFLPYLSGKVGAWSRGILAGVQAIGRFRSAFSPSPNESRL